MEPSTLTHKDEARVQLLHAFAVFNLLVVAPYLTFLLTSNFLVAVALGILCAGSSLDIALTFLGIAQGYKEGNFYRILVEKFGNEIGMKIMISMNLTVRGLIILFLYPYPSFLFLASAAFLAAPLWNAMSMLAFHNDIVLTVPTVVSGEGNEPFEIPTIEKTRLETRKDNSLYTLEEAKALLSEAGWSCTSHNYEKVRQESN